MRSKNSPSVVAVFVVAVFVVVVAVFVVDVVLVVVVSSIHSPRQPETYCVAKFIIKK